MSAGPSERVAAYWNRTHAAPELDAHENIFHHPLVQAYCSLRAFGELTGQLQPLIVALRERTAPGDRVLSIACGRAAKERVLAEALPDRHFVAVDIADTILAAVRGELAAAGIANLRLEVRDHNRLQLEPGAYACVLGLGAIHHVEALEQFWAQCRSGLRPGGCVIAQEYIGPDRFQWTAAQVREGDRVLRDLVPPELRPHHSRIEREAVAALIARDPSEAVRSSEILPTCRAGGFEVTGFTGVGCSLLGPVLMHQVRAYDPRNWQHNLVLSRLFVAEDELLRAGVLQDDFAMFVAVRR